MFVLSALALAIAAASYWYVLKLQKDFGINHAVLAGHLKELFEQTVELHKADHGIYKSLMSLTERLSILDTQDIKILGHIKELQDALIDLHANVSASYEIMAMSINTLTDNANAINVIPPLPALS